jgi:hypothetical protein
VEFQKKLREKIFLRVCAGDGDDEKGIILEEVWLVKLAGEGFNPPGKRQLTLTHIGFRRWYWLVSSE